MWVKPDLVSGLLLPIKPNQNLISPISVSALWSTERLNQWFVLQKRRGHGDGDQTLLGTTLKSMDSIMFNVLPWRILYIGELLINIFDLDYFLVDELESRYQIAAGWDENEINENWSFLEKESCPQLQEMENQEDRTTFVLAKINSLAQREDKKLPTAAGWNFPQFHESLTKVSEPKKLKEASIRFQQTFSYPATERLVNYFSCTHGNRPGQVIIKK